MHARVTGEITPPCHDCGLEDPLDEFRRTSRRRASPLGGGRCDADGVAILCCWSCFYTVIGVVAGGVEIVCGVACVVVRAPDGREWTVDLDSDRLTVGRATPSSRPDLVLEPDPQRWVGRLHCSVEKSDGLWWLTDNGTVNGTLVWRDGVEERVIGRRRLDDGDVIRIVGDLTDDQLLYWELRFVDPHRTQSAPVDLRNLIAPGEGMCLEYDWVQARVYRNQDGVQTEIAGLRPQAHQLIRYMSEVSRKNGGTPVACSYAELIRALWGEREEWEPYRTYTEQDVRYVVSDVRRLIEPDPANPCLLETVRGFGYRLVICPGPLSEGTRA